ncbi:MAG TPA: hypothetical protein ENG59_01375 [Chloroflexi bacterium]|nr:MAG: hypothetical protein DRI46_10515 [Chloroflexota bacterium]HDD54878.1 hypothetical protein [Chloroflexota bacterium]
MTGIQNHTCIHCGKADSQVPLIVFNYQGGEFRICTEHLPVLIHNPGDLTGKLPDAENLAPADSD